MKQLTVVCEVDGAEKAPTGAPGAPSPPAANVSSIEVAELKMQVPAADGQACWKTAQFDLQVVPRRPYAPARHRPPQQ